MNHKDIVLTRGQKLKALGRALSNSDEVQFIFFVSIVLLLAAAVRFGLSPIVISTESMIIAALAQIAIFVIIAICTMLVCMFFIWVWVEHIRPVVRSIKREYEDEADAMKKEILDNVIEDEILNK